MIKFLKEESALTIVEVLVAVVLTAIVMLHGTVFFISTWRLNAESKDYNTVSNDVVANLERCISRSTNGTAVNTADYVIRTRTLRNKYTVNYTLVKSSMTAHGYYYATSMASWRYGGNDAGSNININIKTAYVPVYAAGDDTYRTRWN